MTSDPHTARGAALPPDLAAREADILGSSPRLAPLQPADHTDEMRAMTLTIRAAAGLPSDAPVGDYVATVLRHPALYRSHTDLAVFLMTQGALTARHRELAVLRIGWLCRAPFEWSAHVDIATRTTDITRIEIERITAGSTAPGWTAHDRAVIAAVEELHADAMISDATWALLADALDERQLLELPILIGQYLGVAFLQNMLRLRLPPDQIGLAAR